MFRFADLDDGLSNLVLLKIAEMTAFVMPMPVSVKAVAFGEAQFHMNRHHLPSQTSSYRSAILPKILVLDLHFAGGWISTET